MWVACDVGTIFSAEDVVFGAVAVVRDGVGVVGIVTLSSNEIIVEFKVTIKRASDQTSVSDFWKRKSNLPTPI